MSSGNIHSVQFYDRSEELMERLCGVVCSGLLIGNSVVVVATDEHRNQLVSCLDRMEVDVRPYVREGRFRMFDAEQMLDTFMRRGRPDRALFLRSLGTLLNDARSASKGSNQGLTVFGEMVALLWKDGNSDAALELEGLWNELIAQQPLHLHCAYPKALFTAGERDMARICDRHSHILGKSAAA